MVLAVLLINKVGFSERTFCFQNTTISFLSTISKTPLKSYKKDNLQNNEKCSITTKNTILVVVVYTYIYYNIHMNEKQQLYDKRRHKHELQDFMMENYLMHIVIWVHIKTVIKIVL